MDKSPNQLFISKFGADLRPQRRFESGGGDLFMALSNCINPAAAILRHQSRDSADKVFWEPWQLSAE